MHKPSSDLERVYKALKDQWGIDNLSCDLSIISDLQKTLRKGEWKITAAVFGRAPGGGNRLVAIWPGFHDKLFGIAIDVGSTTIAAHLTNLSTGEVTASAGLMNPQIRFGEDLMSRVSYVMMNPGGEKEMTVAIRAALNTLAQDVARQGGIELSDILEVVLVGNPVMHHLFLGIDPTELGGAPFALATGLAVTCPAKELDLHLNPGAWAYILPCIAGHVGADTAGVDSKPPAPTRSRATPCAAAMRTMCCTAGRVKKRPSPPTTSVAPRSEPAGSASNSACVKPRRYAPLSAINTAVFLRRPDVPGLAPASGDAGSHVTASGHAAEASMARQRGRVCVTMARVVTRSRPRTVTVNQRTHGSGRSLSNAHTRVRGRAAADDTPTRRRVADSAVF